tara:strand:- start:348 stop:1529 length:1182 start_codon:yes stop_codon:yes gene_type:complete
MSGPTLKVSNRSKMPPFMAMDVMRLAAELEADGSDIVHLEVGQPCSPAPQKVIDALAASMGQVKTHGYSVALGIPELRLRIADHYEQWYGEKIGPERVAVTVGSSMAFAISFLASFDIGDKIAIPNPGYPAYRNLMLGMGLEPVTLNAGPLEGWMPRLKDMEKWDNLPDGLMIASPHNPTGVIIPDNELKDICEWCDENGVRLISDEIYHGLSYKSRCETALKYTDNVIVINSLSKYFSMTGWRIGWMILPEQLLNTAEKLAQNLYISAPTPNQIAAIAAFDCSEELDQNIRRYEENRNILLSGLPAEFLGNAAPCDGAFYIYADISALSVDSVNFAKKLLDETGVATTPGVDFDPINGHRYLRLSFAGATQTMNEAVKRINEFVLTYKRDAA